MTIMEAAEAVLRDVRRPMHVKDLTREMLQRGLWQTKGKTPADSISFTLSHNIEIEGAHSVFVQTGPATFAINDQPAPADPKPSAPDLKGLSFIECARKVLEAFGGGQPMHYRDITARALEQGWLVTRGKTPQDSMYAQIISDNKRREARGELPLFVRHGKGMVSLTRGTDQGLEVQIERHNARIRKALHERLLAMKPGDFEKLVSMLLAAMGFVDVEVTQLSKDGGIDVRGVMLVSDAIRIRMAVQVKRWKPGNNVQAPTVQQVRGSLGDHEQGLIVTTSDFSKGAREEAAAAGKKPIDLVSGSRLVRLLMEHGIGVKSSSHRIFELSEEDLEIVEES
ncbi:MAG: HTH domain-containing protein [Desulfovibrionaceae bacterium]|nr:HTH domain-containing protein [Desulfovibrionaceae bacterium]